MENLENPPQKIQKHLESLGKKIMKKLDQVLENPKNVPTFQKQLGKALQAPKLKKLTALTKVKPLETSGDLRKNCGIPESLYSRDVLFGKITEMNKPNTTGR